MSGVSLPANAVRLPTITGEFLNGRISKEPEKSELPEEYTLALDLQPTHKAGTLNIIPSHPSGKEQDIQREPWLCVVDIVNLTKKNPTFGIAGWGKEIDKIGTVLMELSVAKALDRRNPYQGRLYLFSVDNPDAKIFYWNLGLVPITHSGNIEQNTTESIRRLFENAVEKDSPKKTNLIGKNIPLKKIDASHLGGILMGLSKEGQDAWRKHFLKDPMIAFEPELLTQFCVEEEWSGFDKRIQSCVLDYCS